VGDISPMLWALFWTGVIGLLSWLAVQVIEVVESWPKSESPTAGAERPAEGSLAPPEASRH
jgi:hypothetical protein